MTYCEKFNVERRISKLYRHSADKLSFAYPLDWLLAGMEVINMVLEPLVSMEVIPIKFWNRFPLSKCQKNCIFSRQCSTSRSLRVLFDSRFKKTEPLPSAIKFHPNFWYISIHPNSALLKHTVFLSISTNKLSNFHSTRTHLRWR